MRVLPIKLPGLELQVLKIEKGTLTLIHERIGKKPAEVAIDETEFRALIAAFGENDKTGQSTAVINTSTFGLEVNLAMCTGVAKIAFQRDDGTVSECAFSSSGPLGGGPVMVSAWTLTKSRLSDSTDTDIKEIKVAFSASTSGLTTPASAAETNFQPPAITLTPPVKHEERIATSVEDPRKGKKRANLKVREPTPEPMEDVDEADGDPLSRRFLYMACVSQVHNPTCDIMVEAVLQIDRRHGTLQYGGIPGWNADKLPKRAIALTKMSRAFLAKPITKLVVTGFDAKMGREYNVLNEQVAQGPQAMWASDVDSLDKGEAGGWALSIKDKRVIEKALAECVECAR